MILVSVTSFVPLETDFLHLSLSVAVCVGDIVCVYEYKARQRTPVLRPIFFLGQEVISVLHLLHGLYKICSYT